MKSSIRPASWVKKPMLAIAFCAGLFSKINATIITVCPSGCGYTTITAAMTAANSGDTILLNVTGNYTEKNITVPEKNLVLRGLGKGITILQAAASRADAVNGGRIFTRPAPAGAGGNYFIIEDMTIQNAYAPLSANQAIGGVLLAQGALKGMITKFNRVKFYANETTPGNTNNSGGAVIYISATGTTSPYNAVVEANDCDFDDNKVGNSGAGSGSLTDGPCFNLLGSTNKIDINNCTFTNNNGYTRGGVMYIGATWNIAISNSTFANNTCRNGDGGCFSGRSGNWTFDNCLFKNNSAVFTSLVNGNNGYGGVWLGGAAKWKNCTFYNNSAVIGGAITRTFNGTTEMQLINCTFYGNSASSKGKSIYFGSPGSSSLNTLPFTMVNTIITNGGGAASTELHFNHPYSNFSTNIKNYCNSVANDAASPGTTPTFDFNSGNTPVLGLSTTLAFNGAGMESLSMSPLGSLVNAGTSTAGATYTLPIKDQRSFSRFDLGIDVGSFEVGGILDNSDVPAVSYVPLTNTISTANRILSAGIIDLNGIFWFGTKVPRIYFRKNSGTWFSTAGTVASGNGLTGTWNFTIDNSLMGGVSNGDVISYYVIASDVSVSAQIGSFPLGALATDVNAILSTPLTPSSYTIANFTLPVSLLSFSADIEQNDAQLTWKTADAVNFSHFEVERSVDGLNYNKIGQKDAATGSADHLYTFTDADAADHTSSYGKVLYRLKMVDNDGKFKYSQVVNVVFRKSKKSFVISTQPNPFIERISVSLQMEKSEMVSIRVNDMSGNLVKKVQQMGQPGFSTITINDLSSLVPGIYMLEILKGNERIKEKLVKR
jgi:hypothetical protein